MISYGVWRRRWGRGRGGGPPGGGRGGGARGERPPVEAPKLRPRPLGRGFSVRREDSAFRVEGERVVAFVEMMPVEVEEGRQEMWWRLGRWGGAGPRRAAGAAPATRVGLGRVGAQ